MEPSMQKKQKKTNDHSSDNLIVCTRIRTWFSQALVSDLHAHFVLVTDSALSSM